MLRSCYIKWLLSFLVKSFGRLNSETNLINLHHTLENDIQFQDTDGAYLRIAGGLLVLASECAQFALLSRLFRGTDQKVQSVYCIMCQVLPLRGLICVIIKGVSCNHFNHTTLPRNGQSTHTIPPYNVCAFVWTGHSYATNAYSSHPTCNTWTTHGLTPRSPYIHTHAHTHTPVSASNWRISEMLRLIKLRRAASINLCFPSNSGEGHSSPVEAGPFRERRGVLWT